MLCLKKCVLVSFLKRLFETFFFSNKCSYLGSFSRVSCRIACKFSSKLVVKMIESKENSSAVYILYQTNVMNVYSVALGFISCVKTDNIF